MPASGPTAVKDLRIYQLFRETTKGQGGAATTRFLGDELIVRPMGEVRMPQPQIGVMLENPVSDVITMNHTNFEMSGDLTFEQILHMLNMLLKGVVTGTGAGADKTWVFNPVFTADNALSSFTIERRLTDGSTTWDEEINYCLLSDLQLSGNVGEIAKFRANGFGRKLDRASTLTPAIAIPAVNFVSCADVKLYIDNSFGALGTTLLGTLVSWNLNIRGQYQPKFFQEGRPDRSFGTHSLKRIGYDLQATAEWEATVNAERAKADDRSIRYVRLEAVGAALGGSNYKITVDMAMRYEKGMFDQESDRDGNDSTELRLVSAYDTANLIGIKATVINALAALP